MNLLMFEASVMLLKDFDVYWGTNEFLPALLRHPSVLTVHDLLLLKHPSDQPRSRFFKWRFESSLKRAHAVIADSKTTADDLMRSFPSLRKRIEVGLLGFDVGEGCCRDKSICERRIMDSPYVVMLGAHRPRKNLLLATGAVFRSRQRGHNIKLLVTGDVHSSFEKVVRDNSDFVHPVGVLPKPEVIALLKQAIGLVFPSFYEGFGLPILEAMSVGCPVLALDTPINREIGGAAACLLPDDPGAWAATLERIVSSVPYREQLREMGLHNVGRFSWDKTAALYSSVFSAVAERG